MDISKFKSGEYEQQYEYRSFLPTTINYEWILTDAKTLALLDDATRYLGELNAFSQLIPDVDFFIRMHMVKEATTSSRIEGTQTNMEDALVSEKDIEPEKRDDWQEVQNYIRAMHESIHALDTLPLSSRLLKQAHKELMQGVRGKYKQPGEFRTSQNWIGISLKNAIFVPPHHEHIANLINDLELFMHNQDIYVPHLIRIAILHYQFETIHPFLDGNGRLGRMLITLYLVSFKLLNKPALYLSDFFERNKGDYYDHLTMVRDNNHLLEWIHFFLIGVQETAEKSIEVFKQIIELRDRLNTNVMPLFHTRKQKNAQALLEQLYKAPVVSIQQVSELLDIQNNTASALVNDFVAHNILREITGNKRNRIYLFNDYVYIFKD